MAEFQPPELEQTYQLIMLDLVPEFVWDLDFMTAVQVTEHEEEARVLRRGLIEEGVENPDAITLHHDEILAGLPDDTAERVRRLYGMNFFTRFGKEQLEEDADRREVLSFVIQGLQRRRFDTTEYLHVKYTYVSQGRNSDFEISSVDSIPEVIALHPITEKRGSHFAADVGFIAARLLTDQNIELILADETRERPIVRKDLPSKKAEEAEVSNG